MLPLKHLHVDAGVAIKNLLRPEQQAKLREISFEIAKNGVQKVEADASKRISEKVERVKAGAQKWMDGGRDPAALAERWKRSSSRSWKRTSPSKRKPNWIAC